MVAPERILPEANGFGTWPDDRRIEHLLLFSFPPIGPPRMPEKQASLIWRTSADQKICELLG
jgi:hypothetical protein